MSKKKKSREVHYRQSKQHCFGKRSYETWKEAYEVASRIRRQTDDAVEEFRCKPCGMWHVGHSPERGLRKWKSENIGLSQKEDQMELIAQR